MEASGNIQMAIDKWLFTQHLAGKYLPTLRFYTWSNPTISLGYHQNKYPEAWKKLVWQGKQLDLVKRPTGGRAVLHQGDLTYSVVTSGLSTSRIQAYQEICEFLIAGWEKLGVSLGYGTAGRGGYKLIGSAQLRRNEVILQHGSMRLQPDKELFALVFGENISQPLDFPQGISIDDITRALIEAARDRFNAQFLIQGFTDVEWEEILSLAVSPT
jgi:lipoate---protein ligase